MESLKEEVESNGKLIHYVVIALIQRNGKYLLVNRKISPLGYALVTGHVNKEESEENALKREVKEEIGLKVVRCDLIFFGLIKGSVCSKGAELHKWFLYKCDVIGKIKLNKRENLNYGWFSKEEIKKLNLNISWKKVLKKARII